MKDKPIIKYKKWWHRFSPKHRMIIKLMNDMIEYKWDRGMKEELENNIGKHMEELWKAGRTKIGDQMFYWN